MKEKIKTLKELKKVRQNLRKEGKKVVTTNGVFDILHKGHISCLKEAKSFGDVLIVAINSDASTKRIKGNDRPINNENARAEVLAALECVDYVTVFGEENPIKVLSDLKPDVHVKGGDYSKDLIEKGIVEKNGGIIKIVSLIPGFSTTSLISKVKQNL